MCGQGVCFGECEGDEVLGYNEIMFLFNKGIRDQ